MSGRVVLRAAGAGGSQGGHVPSISWARTRRMAARISLRSSYSPAPRSCGREAGHGYWATKSRPSPALPPAPALARASPARSAPPHRSWTPAARPAAPEQPAARPLAAESCRDIMPVTPTAVARSWRMRAEGRGQDRVPRSLAEGHGAMKSLRLHAGACVPVDVSTNVTHSDVLSTWAWPGHHDWLVVHAHKHPCVFCLYCHVHTQSQQTDTPVLVPARTT